MKTMKDLNERVKRAIANNESIACDLASDEGQILGNVKHMRWFKISLAHAFCDFYPKVWGHLKPSLPN